jgi:hypothetical protein
LTEYVAGRVTLGAKAVKSAAPNRLTEFFTEMTLVRRDVWDVADLKMEMQKASSVEEPVRPW